MFASNIYRYPFLYAVAAVILISLTLLRMPYVSDAGFYFKRIYNNKIPHVLVEYNKSESSCRLAPIITFQQSHTEFSDGLYITARPNHGAGIGHQFGEWLQGIWAAYRLNITYVYTPFLINSAYWNSFLGFGVNEIIEDDLKIRHNVLNVKEFRNNSASSKEALNWILQHRDEYVKQRTKNGSLLLRLHLISNLVSPLTGACFTPLNARLRTKYYTTRLIQPIRLNLYENDIKANRFIVAIHLRCGDSCYDSYRTTPLSSIENTILKLHYCISKYYRNKQVVFHLYSQPPINNTAGRHYQSLLNNRNFQRTKPTPVKIIPHFALNAPITLHHFVTADILLSALSSFSALASTLRTGITLGPIQSCDPRLTVSDYDKTTGNFSLEKLKSALDYFEYIKQRRKETAKLHYQSIEEC